MRTLSAKGAEWLLHCLNVRVWADEVILRTGFRDFMIPEPCGGMRTAVTVLLCILGTGALFGFRWYHIILFLLLGFVQALVLNILRISFMVLRASRMPPAWTQTFLQNSSGVFLFLTVLLVLVEIMCWKVSWDKRRRLARALDSGIADPPDKASILPGFGQIVNKWVLSGLGLLLLAGMCAAAIYKSRPAHRAAMIRDVAENLLQTNVEAAERAVYAGLAIRPDDRELCSKKAYVLMLYGNFKEALTEFEALPGSPTTLEVVRKSWTLLKLGRTDEAVSLVEALPDTAKRTPAIAIIRAELAVLQDEPERVGRNVVIASRSHELTDRVRALFPYLALHGQWRVIAGSDRESPYRKPIHALIAAQANLRGNNIAEAAAALKQGMAAWPDDQRFLDSLSELVEKRPGSEWEDVFAKEFKEKVSNLTGDRLASHIGRCFQLNRPDLAWLAYLRLRKMDPHDPALYISPSLFGDVWFTFRSHQIRVRAESRFAQIDLRPFCLQTGNVKPFESFWEYVPLAEEMANAELEESRGRYLELCLAELARREREGKLSRRLEITYAVALAAAGRYSEAHARLDKIETERPADKANILFRQAIVRNRQEKWQRPYEALMKYYPEINLSDIAVDFVLVNRLIRSNPGKPAVNVANRTHEVFSRVSRD